MNEDNINILKELRKCIEDDKKYNDECYDNMYSSDRNNYSDFSIKNCELLAISESIIEFYNTKSAKKDLIAEMVKHNISHDLRDTLIFLCENICELKYWDNLDGPYYDTNFDVTRDYNNYDFNFLGNELIIKSDDGYQFLRHPGITPCDSHEGLSHGVARSADECHSTGACIS